MDPKTEQQAQLEANLAQAVEENRLLKAENAKLKAQVAQADSLSQSPELKQLVAEKVAAGLPRETAIEVARNQIAENKRREAEAKVPVVEAEAKKPAKGNK